MSSNDYDTAVGLPEHLAPPQGQEAGDPLPWT